MKRSLRNSLVIVTASLVLTSLAACGDVSKGGGGAAGGGGKTPGELTVGGLFAMTGSYASYGEQQSRGVQLAFKEVNAADAAGGVELKLSIEDMQGQAPTAVQAMNKLTSVDKVPWIFTSITNVISATAPIGTQKEVVMMNGGGTAPTLAGLSPYLFSNVPLENLHIQNETRYAREKLNLTSLGILYTNDALGTADSKVMEKTWKDAGGSVGAMQAAETTATDFRPQLTQIAASKPQAIYMALGGQQIATALNQARELGISAQILGTSFWTVPEVVEAAKGASNGVIFSTQQWNPENPASEGAKKFVDAFKAEYGVLPLGNAAAYYVGANILADVVAHLAEKDRPLTGPELRAGILEVGSFDTIFGKLTFSKDGTSEMPLTLMTVRDAKFTPVE